MLPQRERPEFKRRYSAGRRIIFASCFAHDDVLEFFLKAAERARSANCGSKILRSAGHG
jgi:hypothetical protein